MDMSLFVAAHVLKLFPNYIEPKPFEWEEPRLLGGLWRPALAIAVISALVCVLQYSSGSLITNA